MSNLLVSVPPAPEPEATATEPAPPAPKLVKLSRKCNASKLQEISTLQLSKRNQRLRVITSFDNGDGQPLNHEQFALLLQFLPQMENLKSFFIDVSPSPNTTETERMMNVLCNLRNLEELMIENTNVQLKRIPDEIGNLTRLKILFITLTPDSQDISENLYNLTELRELRIRQGSYERLSDNIGNLTNLYSLNVLYNEGIQRLPPTIGQLTNLEDLRLQQTNIAFLPDSITNCTHLSGLRIVETALLRLPENIGVLTNLAELMIVDTSIETLPDSLTQLINLQLFIIRNNRHLPGAIFQREPFRPFIAGLRERIGIDASRLDITGNTGAMVQVPPGQADQGRAYEVHNAFDVIRFNELVPIISPDDANLSNKRAMSERSFYSWLENKLGMFQPNGIKETTPNGRIDVVEPGRTELSNNLKAISHKLVKMGFDGARWGTYDVGKFVTTITKYVDKQPDKFKKNYVKSYIKDNIGAYGENYDNNSTEPNITTSSCTKGMKERILINLRNGGEGLDNPEYYKIARIIGNETVVDDNCTAEGQGESAAPQEIPDQRGVIIENNRLGHFTPMCIAELKAQLLAEPDMERRTIMVTKCVVKKLAEASLIRLPEGGIDNLENIEQYVPNSVRDYLNDENVREMFTDDDYLQGGRRRRRSSQKRKQVTRKRRRTQKTRKNKKHRNGNKHCRNHVQSKKRVHNKIRRTRKH